MPFAAKLVVRNPCKLSTFNLAASGMPWVCALRTLSSRVLTRCSRTRQVVYTYKEGIQWCIQVTEGLQRLHTGSPMIIHRDLKLDNILLAGASCHDMCLSRHMATRWFC